MLLLLHKTLKGSRNIQGFALIRAVLFNTLLYVVHHLIIYIECGGMTTIELFFEPNTDPQTFKGILKTISASPWYDQSGLVTILNKMAICLRTTLLIIGLVFKYPKIVSDSFHNLCFNLLTPKTVSLPKTAKKFHKFLKNPTTNKIEYKTLYFTICGLYWRTYALVEKLGLTFKKTALLLYQGKALNFKLPLNPYQKNLDNMKDQVLGN